MKKLLLILFATLFILSGCETVPSEPSIYGTEPNKFPGEKYTTYYHVPPDVDFLKDEYDPLSNQLYEQNYMLQYASERNPLEIKYQFTYQDIVYKGEYSGEYTNYPTPYLHLSYITSNPAPSKYFAADIWLDSGNVKRLIIDELTVGDGDISKAGILKKANAVASEFIDISDYEINVDMLPIMVTYNK